MSHLNGPGPSYNKSRGPVSAHVVAQHNGTNTCNSSKAVQVNGKGKKRRRKPPITAHLGGTRYEIGMYGMVAQQLECLTFNRDALDSSPPTFIHLTLPVFLSISQQIPCPLAIWAF